MRTDAGGTTRIAPILLVAVAVGSLGLIVVSLNSCGGRLSETEYSQRASDAVEGVATASVELSQAADQASNGIQFMLVVKTAGNRTTKAARELEHLNPPSSEAERNQHLIDALRVYQRVLEMAITAARNENRALFESIRPRLAITNPAVETIRQAAARFREKSGE
jgi:hypothetical protein